MWFNIKVKPCKDGFIHLWEMIKCSRYLKKEYKDIIDPVIERNAFFGNHENILLAITDSRRHIRELGLRRIIAARSKPKSVRNFEVPPINFEASEYIDLINWNDCKLTEPPVLSNLSDEEVKKMVQTGETPDFPCFPCHTQAVERCVKIVTEARSVVSGSEARDGFILGKLNSRNVMPKFNTKNDYKPVG